jgi:hypothetical protein
MKTPRQILLEEFNGADARLADIQKAVLQSTLLCPAQVSARPAQPKLNFVQWLAQTPHLFWTEVILPARRVWAGFAVVWAAILIINASEQSGQPKMAKNSAATENAILVWREQRNILAEFSQPVAPEPADRVRPSAPQPRSETQSRCIVV